LVGRREVVSDADGVGEMAGSGGVWPRSHSSVYRRSAPACWASSTGVGWHGNDAEVFSGCGRFFRPGRWGVSASLVGSSVSEGATRGRASRAAPGLCFDDTTALIGLSVVLGEPLPCEQEGEG
jgi:hypothetical protein